jgi:3-methyl-2-oxobutanoate hydroxymethyltransferase
MDVIEDARAVHDAGAFSILIEGVPPEVTKIVRDELPIPVYSIGAGMHADGQLMIVSDVVGHFQAFTPKFVKRYGDVAGEIRKSVTDYIAEVRSGRFPTDDHCYHMLAGEADALKKRLR